MSFGYISNLVSIINTMPVVLITCLSAKQRNTLWCLYSTIWTFEDPLSARVKPKSHQILPTPDHSHPHAKERLYARLGEKASSTVDGLIALRASHNRRQIRIAYLRSQASSAQISSFGGDLPNIQTTSFDHTEIWVRKQTAESWKKPGRGHVERSYFDAVVPG